MHSYTAKLILRASKKNTKGESPVALQMFINGERCRIATGVYIEAHNWDTDNRQVIGKARSPITKEAAGDINLMLNSMLSKANNIFYEHRLKDQPLNKETMLAEMSNTLSKKSFYEWIDARMEELEGIRGKKTLSGYRVTFRSLKEFAPGLRFSDLTPELPEKFERWLKVERGLGLNSRAKYHRHLKTFTRHLANVQKGIPDIYTTFKVKQAPGPKVYLTRSEVQTLIRMYDAQVLGDHLQDALQMFLFSCHTGLRFSDLISIRAEQVQDNYLSFMPVKTQGIEKRIEVPLSSDAVRFMKNAKGTIFNPVVNQYFGRQLKDIARLAGIRKNLSPHVGRHTFATGYIMSGGSVPVLQRILGHSKIETTMIYVHLSKQRLEEERTVIENIHKKPIIPTNTSAA